MKRRELSPREKVAKARIQLLVDNPFFGCLAMRMRPRELTEEEVQRYGITALAVDVYGNLIYNPQWVKAQQDSVMKTAIAHEVLHLAFKHFWRQGSRSRLLWNIATDAAINDILEKSFNVPGNWVHIRELSGKSAEEIYDWLLKNAQDGGGGRYGTPIDVHIYGGDKEKSDGESESKEGGGCKGDFYVPGQEPFDAESAIKEAWNFAKQQGRVPAGIEKWFKDLLEPTIDWKDYLRRLISSLVPHDFSYTYPHKKSQALGYYIPMVKKEAIEILVAVDTSGSISDREYVEFISEVQGLCRQFESIRGNIILADADVQAVYELTETFDPLSVPRKGYGGTNATPVYRWIEENVQDPKLLIYFTDGYIDLPNQEYPFPTIWVLTSNGSDHEVKDFPNSSIVRIPKRE